MILPIHLLDTGDELEFGKENVLLSRLGRLGFPIAKGFVVSAPHIEIKKYLKVQKVYSLSDFESRQVSLFEYIVDKKPELHTLGADEINHFETHWPELVKRWLREIHSHYTRFSAFDAKHFHLKAHAVVFSTKVETVGVAAWNPVKNLVKTKFSKGDLSPEHMTIVDDLLKRAHKKLGKHYDYSFIVDNKQVVFTRLSEPNHEMPEVSELSQINDQLVKSKARRSIKLLTTFNGSFVLDEVADGYFLNSAQFTSHDQKLMVLLETMIAKHPHEILYEVSKRFYKSDAAAVKYCRNQKKFDNLNLVFNGDQSEEELLELKRDLAVEGVTRKGKMKFWLSVSTPASLMKIEESLSNGFDGVIIDVNLHAALLHAKHISELDQDKDVTALITFLEPVIKKLKKLAVPVILFGSLLESPKMLEKVIKWGVYGVIAEQGTGKMHEVLVYHEQVVQFGLGKS